MIIEWKSNSVGHFLLSNADRSNIVVLVNRIDYSNLCYNSRCFYNLFIFLFICCCCCCFLFVCLLVFWGGFWGGVREGLVLFFDKWRKFNLMHLFIRTFHRFDPIAIFLNTGWFSVRNSHLDDFCLVIGITLHLIRPLYGIWTWSIWLFC